VARSPGAADRVRQIAGALAAPDLSERDPRYLRYGVFVLVAAGLALAGHAVARALMRAFDSGAGLAVTLDAWVDPPAYTGLPPVYLAPGDSNLIAVPAGSVLNLGRHGAQHARGCNWDSNPPRFTRPDGEYTDTAKIMRMRGCGCAPAACDRATGTFTRLWMRCR